MRYRYANLLWVFLFLFNTPAILAQVQVGNTIKGATPREEAGAAIDLSQDGRRVLIGAPHFIPPNEWPTGKIFVVEEQNGQWELVGDPIIGEAILGSFGFNVQISDDGKRIAGSAFQSVNGGEHRGSVRIFGEENGVWIPIGDWIDGREDGDQALTISLSGDGRRIAIGAPGNKSLGNWTGEVNVFEEVAGEWIPVGINLLGRAAGWRNGAALALSEDGRRLVIGAPGAERNGDTMLGAVRVYEEKDGVWLKMGATIYGEASFSGVGGAVAISKDGTVIAVGARGVLQDGNAQGEVKLYRWEEEEWVDFGAPIRPTNALSSFGEEVALANAGNRVAVKSRLKTIVYDQVNGEWEIIVDLPIPQPSESLSLSPDGYRFAYGNPGLNLSEGEVKVYGLGPISNVTNPNANTMPLTIYPNPTSNDVFLSGTIPTQANVNIYSPLGQAEVTKPLLQRLSENTQLLDLSAYPAGMYILQVDQTSYRLFKQ